MRILYCTSFCNRAHDMRTGRPIAHECYTLPLAMLRAERDGEHDRALSILRTKGKGQIVKGRKLRGVIA